MPNNPLNASPSSISLLLADSPPPPYDYQDHDSTAVTEYDSASTEHDFILPPITNGTNKPSKKWWRHNWLKKGWRKLEKGAGKFNEIVLYAVGGGEIREILQRMRREEWERKHRSA
jgi:hypothetical protein